MTTTYPVTVTSSDGETLSFACAADDTLLDGAAKAGIALPAICREGNCGACIGTCTGGQYNMPYYNPLALPPCDVESGKIMMCQTFPRSPLAITVDAPALLLTGAPVQHRQARVVANDDLGGNVRRLALEILPDDAGDIGPSFEPGQYMELEIPGGTLRRAYSLSNAPNWEGQLEFLIRLHPDGKMSNWLQYGVAVGDTLQTVGPKGHFGLQAGGLNPRRFVAGGTGLAPLLSMLRQMAAFGETTPAHLYFGVNSQADLFGQELIAAVQADLPQLGVTICLWKPDPGWDGFTGSPADALAGDLADDVTKGRKPEVYVCGPPGLVDAVRAQAAATGLPDDRVFAERFLPT